MILVAPEPVNATLNTTAAFHCVATGRLIGWVVNGDPNDTPEAMARGVEVTNPRDPDGIVNSTLTIPATIDNDDITISCEVAIDGYDRSPDVLLRVQGMYARFPMP